MNDRSKTIALVLAGSLYLGTSSGQPAAPKAPGTPPPPAPTEVLEELGVQGERLAAANQALAAHRERMEASRDRFESDLAAILTAEELEIFLSLNAAPRPPAPPAPPAPGRFEGRSD